MTNTEMIQLLELVKTEHAAFDLKPDRARMWFERFGNLKAQQFGKLVKHVLDNQRFTPTFSDFAKGQKELFGNAITDFKMSETFREDYDQALKLKNITPKYSSDAHGRQIFRYESLSELNAILGAFGHKWYNEKLGLKDARACLSFMAKIGKEKLFNHQYMDWRKLAAEAAYKKNAQEPFIEPEFGTYSIP